LLVAGEDVLRHGEALEIGEGFASSITPTAKPAALAALAMAMDTWPPPKRYTMGCGRIGSTKISTCRRNEAIVIGASLLRLKTILRGVSFCMTCLAAATRRLPRSLRDGADQGAVFADEHARLS